MPAMPTYKEVNFIEFKIHTLKVILLMCGVGVVLYDLSVAFDLIDSTTHQVVVNSSFLLASIALYFWLKKRPDKILLISKILAVSGFLTFAYSAFQYNDNCFRFIWFLPLIIFTFFFISCIFGVTTAISSILVVIFYFFNHASMTNEALWTLIISFLAVAFLANHYSNQIGSYEDKITEQNQTLQKMITHDPMTGILNRYGIMEYATHYCSLAHRDETIDVSLVIFDIDRFKDINDTYGHLVGDGAIIFLAEEIQKMIRKSDLFARMGGDEFILLLPHTPKSNAKHMIEQIRNKLSTLPFDTGKKDIFIKVSAGIAQRTSQTENFDQLFIEADKALYQAKEAGRNCTVIYGEG